MKALRFAMLCGMSGAMKAPPLTDARRLTLSYKTLATRAAEGVNAAFAAGHRRVSVEIPQISSVDRSTIARRFEDDNNWLLALIEILGGCRPEPIGPQVSIFEGGFEGGGDYLSSEGLYGYRWKTKGSSVTAARAPLPAAPARPARRHLYRRAMQVGNSEVGSTALRDLKALDDGGKLLLFNLGLDRLSIFDRIGRSPFLRRRAGGVRLPPRRRRPGVPHAPVSRRVGRVGHGRRGWRWEGRAAGAPTQSIRADQAAGRRSGRPLRRPLGRVIKCRI